MGVVLSAILPVFALLLLGNVARRTGFLREDFWREVEKGTYYILFPALLVEQLATAKMDFSTAGGLLALAVLMPLLASVLTFLFAPLLRLNGADFTSFYQGGVRFNTYIGLALVAATLPASALTLAALVVGVMIPLVNVLCIGVFAWFTHGRMRLSSLLLSILKNPLIMACLLGMVLNLLPFAMPDVVLKVLEKLGQMALPLGLLAVGAGLRLQALKASGAPLFWVSAVKLLLLPALMYGLCVWMQVGELERAVLVTFAALPTASSAYILARQLGGNAAMMAVLITGETVFGMLTLPLVLLAVI